jgi:hypothetical protein
LSGLAIITIYHHYVFSPCLFCTFVLICLQLGISLFAAFSTTLSHVTSAMLPTLFKIIRPDWEKIGHWKKSLIKMVQIVTSFFQPFQSKSVKSPVFHAFNREKKKATKTFSALSEKTRPQFGRGFVWHSFFSRPLLSYAAEF